MAQSTASRTTVLRSSIRISSPTSVPVASQNASAITSHPDRLPFEIWTRILRCMCATVLGDESRSQQSSHAISITFHSRTHRQGYVDALRWLRSLSTVCRTWYSFVNPFVLRHTLWNKAMMKRFKAELGRDSFAKCPRPDFRLIHNLDLLDVPHMLPHDQALVRLLKECSSLSALSLHINCLSIVGLADLARATPGVRRLFFRGFGCSDSTPVAEDYVAVQRWIGGLIFLDLSSLDPSQSGYPLLDLIYASLSAQLEYFRASSRSLLKAVHLENVQGFSVQDWDQLEFPHMTAFSCSYCPFSSEIDSIVLAHARFMQRHQRSLRHVDISRIPIGPCTWEVLKTLRLESLVLNAGLDSEDSLVEYLTSSPNACSLKSLSLNSAGPKVSDRSLVTLARRCPQLQRLDVRKCRVSEWGLSKLYLDCAELVLLKASCSVQVSLSFIKLCEQKSGFHDDSVHVFAS
ncbi:uncharacterized protein BJ171DRAFT_570836 [Polychytrium aggregatum]|uniref:uncharacterized protein n=1 Tax=Polychytrium aggregatum TaxID=110093 RepID=UPI0022FE9005|nr:uncharacterized protein BJ171DRAFT_570836 [Polychytrium aggregatum]KAI9197273.1 hypothetical protein BJ171DRAFT_570836 [Polychytrium aggregatum]